MTETFFTGHCEKCDETWVRRPPKGWKRGDVIPPPRKCPRCGNPNPERPKLNGEQKKVSAIKAVGSRWGVLSGEGLCTCGRCGFKWPLEEGNSCPSCGYSAFKGEKYKCSFENCRLSFRTKKGLETHKGECFWNPVRKACLTCAHLDLMEGYLFAPMKWECKFDSKINTPNPGCERWEARRKLEDEQGGWI